MSRLLLVLSDTHGELSYAKRAIEKYAPDTVIHLGDHWRDAQALERQTGLPFVYVRGNCDPSGAPESDILTVCSSRLLLAHGHRYGVKLSLQRLSLAAEEAQADAALFGHTHEAHMSFAGRILLLNPGSAGRPAYSRPTCALLKITPDGIFPELKIIE